MDFVTFGLILDDVVYPDGRTAMGMLGGGGPQTAFGMRLWSESVGLVAEVGPDLPEDVLRWIRESGVDGAGLHFSDKPTVRAWQLLEADGRRRHVWRMPGPVTGAQLGRSLACLPEAYRGARGFHFGVHAEDPNLEFAAGLRALGGVVSLELFRPAERRLPPEALRALLAAADIISLSLEEARSLAGPYPPLRLARQLIDAGAPVLALRMGEGGSLVVEGKTGKAARIPAAPVKVVDEIGAGNAYCGGFLAGWVEEQHDLVAAGLQGAIAASLLIEQFGVPTIGPETRVEARDRLKPLRSRVERVEL
jgi:sugar/nucleoside kinase (ribokinase family)